MCDDVMQMATVRCPDCKARLQIPYSWCADLHIHTVLPSGAALGDSARGFHDGDGRFVDELLRRHAREMPILHPTLLPEHHKMRRTA